MFKKFIPLLVLCACVSPIVVAQTSSSTVDEGLKPGQPPTWQNEKWDANEKPYVAIRSKVFKDFPKGVNAKLLMQRYAQYRVRAEAKPRDALAQFALGYASYRAILLKLPILNVWQVAEAIGQVPSPRSYQFARMRYLLEKTSPWYSRYENFVPSLKVVGTRLLQRFPNDYDVKFFHIPALDVRKPQERQLAFKYANDLIRTKPRGASSYSALGDIYHRIWIRSNLRPDPSKKGKQKWIGTLDTVNRDKAIAAYRKSLQFLDPKSEEYRRTERLIQHMLKGLPL